MNEEKKPGFLCWNESGAPSNETITIEENFHNRFDELIATILSHLKNLSKIYICSACLHKRSIQHYRIALWIHCEIYANSVKIKKRNVQIPFFQENGWLTFVNRSPKCFVNTGMLSYFEQRKRQTKKKVMKKRGLNFYFMQRLITLNGLSHWTKESITEEDESLFFHHIGQWKQKYYSVNRQNPRRMTKKKMQ